MAHKPGSKTITDAKWQKACRLIARGASKQAALLATGISRSTFYRYLELCSGPEANEQQRGRFEQYQAAMGEDMIVLEKIAASSVAGAMFLLARRYPETYGDAAAQVTEQTIEHVLRVLEAIREGILGEQEISDQVGPSIAERLFRAAGAPVGASESSRPEPLGRQASRSARKNPVQQVQD